MFILFILYFFIYSISNPLFFFFFLLLLLLFFFPSISKFYLTFSISTSAPYTLTLTLLLPLLLIKYIYPHTTYNYYNTTPSPAFFVLQQTPTFTPLHTSASHIIIWLNQVGYLLKLSKAGWTIRNYVNPSSLLTYAMKIGLV